MALALTPPETDAVDAVGVGPLAPNPFALRPNLRGVRIACFYPWRPFEPTGSWTRFCCLWQFLREAGADVTLAFLEKGNDVRLNGINVRYLGEWNVLNNIGAHARALVSSQGTSELRHYTSAELNFLLMFEKGLYLNNARTGPWLDAIVSEHDLVTCEYPMYAPLLSEFCRKWQRPLVVTSLDMLFELHGTHPGAKERLRQKEVQALGLADAVVFCNDREREVFAGHGVNGITVMNTGDVLSVTPGNEETSREAMRRTLKIKTAHYCLLVGSEHAPNVAAAADVRILAKTMPDVTFVVAGACHPKVAEGNFVALGPVSGPYLDSLYRGALAVVVPLLRGTGASVKFFQALTYAKPVVSTAEGARGYDVADGVEFLLARRPQDFPASIRRLMTDGGLRQRLTRDARAYAVRHDFRTHFQPYADIVIRLAGGAVLPPAELHQALVLVDNNLCDRIGHHFNYALALKAECAAQGFAFQALVKLTAEEAVRAELSAGAIFSQGIHEENPLNPFPAEWGAMRANYDFLRSNDVFATELEAGLSRRVRPGDVIFLPNATPRQMLGVALLLLRNPIYRTLRFVLLLRYSVHVPAGPLADRKVLLDKDSHEQYALALEKLVSADPDGAVRLVTDSAELAKEFGSFSKRALKVLPIPHTRHSPSPAWPAEIPVKSPGNIRLVYMGDAREEKGFELLPAVVRACAALSECAKVEFVFHAFISSPYHHRMAAPIEELTRLGAARVHLVRSPLTADAYHALLDSADLVLLPYDAATYRARTSGPFVEAICADKPVVVPAKSWMSAQLAGSAAGATFTSGSAPDLTRAVLTALSHLGPHTAAAVALGRQFREYHNPPTFLKQLMTPA